MCRVFFMVSCLLIKLKGCGGFRSDQIVLINVYLLVVYYHSYQPVVVDNSQTQTEKKFKTTVDIENLLLKDKSVDTKHFELM